MDKKLRMEYDKTGFVAFISHKDLIRMFERTLRAIDFPLKFSEGFSPHPKMTFSSPLPVGVEGKGELIDIEVSDKVDPNKIVPAINEKLPYGIRVKKAYMVDKEEKSINTQTKATYILQFRDNVSVKDVSSWMKANPKFHKITKSGKKKENLLRDSVSTAKVYMKRFVTIKVNIQGGISFSSILHSLLQHIQRKPQDIMRIRRIW